MGELIKAAEAQAGVGRVLVVLTADHGVAPVPEVNEARNMPGGRIAARAIGDAIQQTLETRFGAGRWVVYNSAGAVYFDPALIVPDETATLRKGAIAPWSKTSSPYYLQTLEALARHYKFSLNDPWEDLPKRVQNIVLNGSGEDGIKFIYDDGLRRYETKKTFEGVIPNMQRRFKETDSAWIREELER